MPDDLLPARVDSRPVADALKATRIDGPRYRSFVRRIEEEVVLHETDLRREPAVGGRNG